MRQIEKRLSLKKLASKPEKNKVVAWYAIHTVWLSGMHRLVLTGESCTESFLSFYCFFLEQDL